MRISLRSSAILAGLIATATPATAQVAPVTSTRADGSIDCTGTMLGCIEEGMKAAKRDGHQITLHYDPKLPGGLYKGEFNIDPNGEVHDITPEEPEEDEAPQADPASTPSTPSPM